MSEFGENPKHTLEFCIAMDCTNPTAFILNKGEVLPYCAEHIGQAERHFKRNGDACNVQPYKHD